MNAHLGCPAILSLLLAAAVPTAATAAPSAADFDAIAARAAQARTAPGFAFAVVRSGAVVYARGFGVADVARGEPVTPSTRFAIGSVSKEFTAAAILQLRDARKLQLDGPLSAYLPQFPNAQTITLRMLLNHDSGLHNYPNTNEHPWPVTGTIDPNALFAIMATDAPDFAPGARYGYSNTDYAALAGVVTRASGVPYGTYVVDRILGPLGMSSSGSGYAAQRQGTATPYTGAAPFTPAQPPISLDLFYGAGSIVSNVNDLVRWDVALMHGTLLGAASVHDLWTPGMLPNGAPIPYAMGFVPQTLYGHREVWHNGYSPGAGGYCYNAIFPDDDLAVIVLSNGAAFQGTPESMVAEVLAAYFPGTPTAGDATAALAQRLLHDLRAGDIARDTGDLTPAMQAALTPAVVAQTRDAYFPLGGDPTTFALASRTDIGGGLVQYTYRATFANGLAKDVVMTLDSGGKVAGFFVR
ncbi:MAG: D-alanyl-D-alanine carboxypeptidase [Candidatus Eremiobacteraeota bacterium]|nr:D-alanyl-D-alanine carboxypeptidase [Candidatus Eremiobacteraeota bacterium]